MNPVALIHKGDKAAIIYLGQALLLTSICLPTQLRRAALRRWYIWHFSTQGLPEVDVTIQLPWALTPRFQLYHCCCQQVGSNFLWHFLVLFKEVPQLAGCVALCCPDFPYNPPLGGLHDSAACSGANISVIKF